jgi:RNA polymerase sigma-70 factor (ECF subfamily)
VPTAEDKDQRFARLLEAHKGILYKVASGFCRDPQDRADLIQEIVVQLWRSFDRYDERAARFSTWMYRVAMNVAISARRSERARAHEKVPLDEAGVELSAADAAMQDAGDDVRLLQALVARLPDVDRALVLLYLDGYSHEEIASILGISATNASTRISRLKDRLQRDLDAAAQEKRR